MWDREAILRYTELCKLVVVERRKLNTVEDKWTAIKLIINGEKENKEERSQGLMGYELHKKEES